MYAVIVIGAGPAGLAAAAVALRRRHKTVLVAPDIGGKAMYRLQLPWLSEREHIMGEEIVEQLRQTILTAPDATRYLDVAEHVFRHNDAFHVVTENGGMLRAQTVVVASGVAPHALQVPGELRLAGYGVTYSATSHAPLFAGRRVVVVGDDDRALRAVLDLRVLAEHVTLIAGDAARLDGTSLGRSLRDDATVTVLAGRTVSEIVGDDYVAGVVVAGPDGGLQHIAADGVFIECGLVAHTKFLGTLVERAADGRVIVDDRGASSVEGLYAAGDVTSAAHAEQVLSALGDGTRAGLSACAYLAEHLRMLAR